MFLDEAREIDNLQSIRNAGKNLLLVFCALFFVLLAFELSLHGYAIYLNHKYPEVNLNYSFWAYDPMLGWKNAPGWEGYFTNQTNRFHSFCQINSKGLRDEEYPYEKNKNTKRILLLGDSFTAGFEVEKKQTLDARLENLLKSRGHYEVLNAGVRGFGTDQSYLYLKNEGYRYSPDIIVYIFTDNDLTENVTIHQPMQKYGKPYFELAPDGNLELKGSPVSEQFNAGEHFLLSDKKLEAVLNQKLEDKKKKQYPDWLQKFTFQIERLYLVRWIKREILSIRALNEPSIKDIHEYPWQVTEKIIAEMNAFSNKQGARFIVFEATSGAGKMPKFPTPLQQICNHAGVAYLNAFHEFYGFSKGKRILCFPQDPHWNAKGHALTAKRIYDFLSEKNWI